MTPIGQECKITYRWFGEGPPPEPGDGLRTTTGRTYLITEVRPIKTRSGECRLRLTVLVLGPEDGPPERIFSLSWDKRGFR